MPWSNVCLINSGKGTTYLKQMAEPFKIEASLMLHLAPKFPQLILDIVGYNVRLCCFLMLNAGRPLRDYLKHHYDVRLAISALSKCAKIPTKCY